MSSVGGSLDFSFSFHATAIFANIAIRRKTKSGAITCSLSNRNAFRIAVVCCLVGNKRKKLHNWLVFDIFVMKRLSYNAHAQNDSNSRNPFEIQTDDSSILSILSYS